MPCSLPGYFMSLPRWISSCWRMTCCCLACFGLAFRMLYHGDLHVGEETCVACFMRVKVEAIVTLCSAAGVVATDSAMWGERGCLGARALPCMALPVDLQNASALQ